jgi:hypothetical protein
MNKQRGYYSLKIGGEQRTMHFSMNFWASLTETLDVAIEELDKVFTGKAYDQEEGNEIDYNIYKVGSWLDDLPQDEFQNIMTAMTETKILGNELNAGIERQQKKSQVQKK